MPKTRVTFLCSGKASFGTAVTVVVTAVRLAMCGISELQASQPVFAGFISSLSAVHFSRYNINWCQRSSSSSAEAHGLRIIWLHNLLSLSYKKILPTWLGYWQTELVCWGYYNQRPLSGWLKWQKFFFSILQSGSPRSVCQWVWFLLRPLRGLQMTAFSLHPSCMWSFFCALASLVPRFLLVRKTPIILDYGLC